MTFMNKFASGYTLHNDVDEILIEMNFYQICCND